MSQEGARQVPSSTKDGPPDQDQSQSEAPMSDYNSNALTALRGELKTKVVMGPLLIDMLETSAGGFMTMAEALTVQKANSQMGELITILLGKGDKEFDIFCDMLRKSNHCAWADSLKQKAESLRARDGTEVTKKELERSHCGSQATCRCLDIHCAVLVITLLVCFFACRLLGEVSDTRQHKDIVKDSSMDSTNLERTLRKTDSTIIALPAMPTELQVISSVFIGNKVYVTGFAKIKTAKDNAAKDDVSRRVQVYSLREGEWSTLREAPNYNAPTAVINGRITLIGGRDAQSDITDVMSWLENEHSWVKMQMPTRRLESSVCYHDNLLLVTGGVVYSSQKKEDTIVVNTVDVHNFSSNHWSTPKALELPKALRSHQIVFLKDSLFLMSGAFTFPAPPEDGEMQYNPEAWRAQWSDVIEAINHPTKKSVWIPITAPPFLRSTVVPCEESLLSIGGVKDGMPQKAIYKFVDEKTENYWTEVGSMSVGKYRHGVVPVCNGNCGAALFVAGGYVRSVPEGEETNVKSSSVELVLL